MKLTPLDIKKQEFTRSFRGVDAQEVYNFLQMVGDQWNNLLDENRRLEQKVKEYDSKLEHYRKIEEALQEALETARDNSHKTIENAQREAQIILKEARSASEEIRKKASTDHKRLKHDISKISGRRDEVIARLRAFLMSELELLSRFEGQDAIGYVRLDPGDSKQLRGRGDYYNEVNINAAYHSQPVAPQQPPQQPPNDFGNRAVDLPVNEEETTYEEEIPINETFAKASPEINGGAPKADEFNAQPEKPTVSASEGLSTDELEFIKSTVSSATQQPVVDDIFKPAEPEIDATWQQSMAGLGNTGVGGANNGPVQSGDGRSNTPPPPQEADDSWIVRHGDQRPANNQRAMNVQPNQQAPQHSAPQHSAPQHTAPQHSAQPNPMQSNPTTPASRRPSLGGFASPLFGPDSDQDDLSATPEEIEKIRRILNDLD